MKNNEWLNTVCNMTRGSTQRSTFLHLFVAKVKANKLTGLGLT